MLRNIIIYLILISNPVAAQSSFESMEKANNLGTVLGSEDFCGIEFNQVAIAKWIAENVSADDMAFPSTLSMMIDGTSYEFDSYSASRKTAHCAQIRRISKSYGFIE